MCEHKTEDKPRPKPEGMDDVSIDALIGIARATVAVMVREVMHEVMQAILIDDRDGRLRAVATIMRQQLELEQQRAN